MGLDDFVSEETDNPMNLEQRVRDEIRNYGYNVEKSRQKGISGNIWELDAVAYSDGGSPVAYFEVKDPAEDVAKATYRNHMIRAVAELTDFRDEEIPGAVVIPEKRKFGNKNWDDLFESIGCELIEQNELSEFLSKLDE